MADQNPHLNEQQFKVKITPKQADALNAHVGGSEYLDRAQDAGASWNSSSLTIPHEAVPHMAGFLNMRAEIARDYQTEDYKTPDQTAHHRTFTNLHKNVSATLGDQMRGR